MAARAALAQLKALWQARLKLMRDNTSDAANAINALLTGAQGGVAQVALDSLTQPLKHIHQALRSHQEIQRQYLADLRVRV